MEPMSRDGGEPTTWKVVPLAGDPVPIAESPNPAQIAMGHTSMAVLSGGRVIVSVSQFGPGVKTEPGKKHRDLHTRQWSQTRILSSADQGRSWAVNEVLPFTRGCLFRDGGALYILGDADGLFIARSADGGSTWTKPAALKLPGLLATGHPETPENVLELDGRLYAVAMLQFPGASRYDLAPVLMSAPRGENLTQSRFWTFSDGAGRFSELVAPDDHGHFGVPFFHASRTNKGHDVGRGRWAHDMGWQRAHAVHLSDPNHYWNDPEGRTLHILTQANTQRANIGAMARFTRDDAGVARLQTVSAPSGIDNTLVPLPGGHLPFSVVHDKTAGLYWLACQQSRDSMTRAEALSKHRQGLPSEERNRLQLLFSRNLVDWCFAGFLSGTARDAEARQGPRLAIHGTDLYVLFCAGDEKSRSARKPNRVLFHCIPDFRDLAY
jgi:hypothetical protein